MALDEAMAQACGQGLVPPTLRFYGWDRPTLSLGYSQKTGDEIRMDLCAAKGIPIVRRPTGGKAVFHDRELTYSVSARTDDPLFTGGIGGTYRVIAEAFLAGLRLLGISAEMFRNRLGRPPDHPLSPSCFASPYGHEIAVHGKKLIGSAQRRWRDRFLQHGSILLSPSPEFESFFRMTPIPTPPGGDPPFTTLEEVLGHPVSESTIRDVICRGFQETLKVDLQEGVVQPLEEEWAKRLEREKYGTEEWTFKR
jgi:lipoate-protein ligase A